MSAIIRLEKSADEFDPLSSDYSRVLSKAAEQYHDFYRRHRAQKGGLFARLYEARCYKKQRKYEKALSILDELWALKSVEDDGP